MNARPIPTYDDVEALCKRLGGYDLADVRKANQEIRSAFATARMAVAGVDHVQDLLNAKVDQVVDLEIELREMRRQRDCDPGRMGVPLRDSVCNCPETGQDEPPTRTIQKVTGQ